VFDIIDARCNHEDQTYSLLGAVRYL